jgi:hypothetical protein
MRKGVRDAAEGGIITQKSICHSFLDMYNSRCFCLQQCWRSFVILWGPTTIVENDSRVDVAQFQGYAEKLKSFFVKKSKTF